jgi:DNA repair protein RadC
MKRIKELPEFSRPREKFQEKGVAALSDVELVALILGRGTAEHHVMELASRIAELVKAGKGQVMLEQLTDIDGIGVAKAAQVLAGIELARRYFQRETVTVTGAKDVVPLLSDIVDKKQEYFVCFSLNGAHEMIQRRVVTVGLLNKTQVHPREVFADVIEDRAAAVILAHNHPSGQLKPGDADLKIHEQLTEAGKILGITVLDHVIVAKGGYFSFQEQGII